MLLVCANFIRHFRQSPFLLLAVVVVVVLVVVDLQTEALAVVLHHCSEIVRHLHRRRGRHFRYQGSLLLGELLGELQGGVGEGGS